MIGTEVTVFAALFAAGLGAGVLASFLLALGRGSRVARVIFDLVAPPAVGAIWFFTLRGVASGVFRLYALLAYLVGILAARGIVGTLSKPLSRLLLRVKVPIMSLEKKCADRLDRVLTPLRERRTARKKARAEERTKRAARRAEMRAIGKQRKAHPPVDKGDCTDASG